MCTTFQALPAAHIPHRRPLRSIKSQPREQQKAYNVLILVVLAW